MFHTITSSLSDDSSDNEMFPTDTSSSYVVKDPMNSNEMSTDELLASSSIQDNSVVPDLTFLDINATLGEFFCDSNAETELVTKEDRGHTSDGTVIIPGNV